MADITPTVSGKQKAGLQAENAELRTDNARYKKTARELKAEKSGIMTATSSDPREPGRRGRPSRQKTTINKRPGSVDGVVAASCLGNAMREMMREEWKDWDVIMARCEKRCGRDCFSAPVWERRT